MFFSGICEATYVPRLWSGKKITSSFSREWMIFTALAEVQQISLSAFTAAEVLMYATVAAWGNLSFHILTVSGFAVSAKGQPASGAGKRTVLSGERTAALSAMK